MQTLPSREYFQELVNNVVNLDRDALHAGPPALEFAGS
jgi:hypothetical protein